MPGSLALVEPAGISGKTATGRPFKPGQSGNPKGRPKGSQGLAAYIRRRTSDGRDIADAVLGVLLASDDPRLRLEAATWLANRAFGTPVQVSEQSGDLRIEVVYDEAARSRLRPVG